MPNSSDWLLSPRDTTWTPKGFDLQGHRGARGLAPENTLPAFRRALEIGVTTLELDVVISEDGVVVVSHEPWMNPEICSLASGDPVPEDEGRHHNLYRMSYAEIERYDCGQRRHPDFPRQDPQPAVKPRLRDVISMAETYTADHDRPPVYYNVEIKSRPDWEKRFHPPPEQFARRVLEVVHEMDVVVRTTIQSFDGRALRATQRLRNDRDVESAVRLGLLVLQGTADRLSAQLNQFGFTPAVYTPEYQSVDAALLRAARDHGLCVIPWTVNDEDDMRRLIQLGTDGFITDYPDIGKEVLKESEDSAN